MGLLAYTFPNFVDVNKVNGFRQYDIALLLYFLHICCLVKNQINILFKLVMTSFSGKMLHFLKCLTYVINNSFGKKCHMVVNPPSYGWGRKGFGRNARHF